MRKRRSSSGSSDIRSDDRQVSVRTHPSLGQMTMRSVSIQQCWVQNRKRRCNSHRKVEVEKRVEAKEARKEKEKDGMGVSRCSMPWWLQLRSQRGEIESWFALCMPTLK